MSDYLAKQISGHMDDNEALRRILYLLNDSLIINYNLPIQGMAADGAPAVGNPVLVGGKDPAGTIRAFKLNSDGHLKVELVVGDLTIGAVELKNGTTDDRAKIETDGDLNVRSDEMQALLTAGNASVAAINTATGAQADSAAGSDTATASLISLVKRGLQSLTTSNTNTAATAGSVASMDTKLTATNTKLDTLETGKATAALQTTGNTSLSSIDTKLTATNTKLDTLESGKATAANQTTGNTSLASIDSKLTGFATAANQATEIARIGATNESAAGTDTATSGLNGLFKRLLQRITTLLSVLPSALVGGRFDVNIGATGVTQPVSGTVTANAGTNLNTSALALETTQAANGVLIGAVNETAPASDTASSGMNGRLQRIAQRLTSLIEGLVASSAGNASVTTSGTGANYQALTSQACRRVILVNDSGTDLEVQQGGSGVAIPVFADTAFVFDGLSNASNLGVRRVDQSNTQVSAKYRWEA